MVCVLSYIFEVECILVQLVLVEASSSSLHPLMGLRSGDAGTGDDVVCYMMAQ
jgi:hypothetical protein